MKRRRGVPESGSIRQECILPDSGDVELPLGQLYTTGIRFVTGRVAARHELPRVLDLVASGRLDPGVVTATTAAWSDAPAAWSTHRDKLVLIR